MRKEDISNTFVHLTNVAIQKHAPGFDRSKGMKWAIRSLRLYMTTRHGAEATNELFGVIQGLIIRTLLAVQPAMINDKHCFEVSEWPDCRMDRSRGMSSSSWRAGRSRSAVCRLVHPTAATCPHLLSLSSTATTSSLTPR